MNIKQAYNSWAEQYDSNDNKTRDLEAISLRTTLSSIQFDTCLEIGCGTGKNTEWLITKAKQVTAVDLSDEMLAKAKETLRQAQDKSDKISFHQADVTEEWAFAKGQYDLVTFSLMLEHIEDLEAIFKKVSKVVSPNGFVYVGELHPFKQYSGSKARFDTEEGQQIVTCFNHNISDFTQASKANGFEIMEVQEYFDDNDRTSIPRILTLLLKKKQKTTKSNE